VMRWLLAFDIAVPTLGADVVGSRLLPKAAGTYGPPGTRTCR
jgi:hypothetical protein